MPFDSVAGVNIWVLIGIFLVIGAMETVAFRRMEMRTNDALPVGLSAVLALLAVGSIIALIVMAFWFLDDVIFGMPGW